MEHTCPFLTANSCCRCSAGFHQFSAPSGLTLMDINKIVASAKSAGLQLDPAAASFVIGYQQSFFCKPVEEKKSPPDVILKCTCGKPHDSTCNCTASTCANADNSNQQVRVQICGSKGKVAGNCGRIECGCCDCRSRLAYCESLGGPKMLTLPQLLYFPNDIKVLSGKENFSSFKLNELTPVENVFVTCCNSHMFTVHPFFQGRLFMTFYRDSADPETKVDSGAASRFENVQTMPPIACRGMAQDLSDETIKAIPYKGPYGNNFDVREISYDQFMSGLGWIFAQFQNFELTTEGQTVQSLIEEIGGSKALVDWSAGVKLSANGSGQPGSDVFNKIILPQMKKAEAEAKAKAEADAKTQEEGS